MSKKTIWLGCLTAVLACIIILLSRLASDSTIFAEEVSETEEDRTAQNREEEADFLSVEIIVGSGSVQQQIKLYRIDNVCYVFLPAYADLSGMQCSYGEDVASVLLDGQEIVKGQKIRTVEIGKEYEIEIKGKDNSVLQAACIFLQSQYLPSVFIDTVSGSLDYVNEVKGNEESGYFTCITAEGTVDSQSVVSKIKGRGNSSWSGNGSKNQYNMRLREETDVLQMGSARNWVLQSNKSDESMLKNKLSYDFAKDIGVPYAVDSEFADFYCNGEYMGTYLICEKIEVAENRVETCNQYLIERDDREEDSDILVESPYGNFAVHTPQNMTESERDYLTDYLNRTSWSIQNAADSDEYLNYIDAESFAKLYMMNEISNDPDANRLSAFYYKQDEQDSRLTAGPVWDFDWAYGYELRGSEPLVSGFEEGWFRDLYRSETFRNCLQDICKEMHDEVYDNYRDTYFEGQKEYLSESYYMNMIRWQQTDDKASALKELETAVEDLQTYFAERIEILNNVFYSGQEYHKVTFVYSGGQDFTHIYVKDGTTIPEEVVEHLRSVYRCVPVKISDGEEIDWTAYTISQDIDIECGAEENQFE